MPNQVEQLLHLNADHLNYAAAVAFVYAYDESIQATHTFAVNLDQQILISEIIVHINQCDYHVLLYLYDS